jgi:hypothetical protein
VLANDTDPDGGPKTIVSWTNGSHGTVAITGGGTGLTHQPVVNSEGANRLPEPARPPGFEPVTFGFVDPGGFPVESG